MSEIIEVRQEEQLPLDRVNDYIEQHIEGVPSVPLQIKQFSAGHSNLTYLLQKGDWEAVLRRP
ncbi:MAG TPA: phosphotransferase family protein, partial [Savagea sp.]